MSADPPDPYFRKLVGLELDGERLEFETAHTLFSAHEVDAGTRLLLRCIAPARPPQRALDLGCGYGAIGIALARRFPEARVTLADRDLLAVRYARRNAARNGAANVEVTGAVGMEGAPAGSWDLIAANVPAKIGAEAIVAEFLRAPRERLAPGGACWFVVVSGLNQQLARAAARESLPLRRVRKRARHTVYRMDAAS